VGADLDDEIARMALLRAAFTGGRRDPVGLRRHDRIEQGRNREQPVALHARHRPADPPDREGHGGAAMGNDREGLRAGGGDGLAQQPIEPQHRNRPPVVKRGAGENRVGVRHRRDREIVSEPDNVIEREMVRPGAGFDGERRLFGPLPPCHAGFHPRGRRHRALDRRARSRRGARQRQPGDDLAEIERTLRRVIAVTGGRHPKHLVDRERVGMPAVPHHHGLAAAAVRSRETEDGPEIDHGNDDVAQAGDAQERRPRARQRRQPRHRRDTSDGTCRQGESLAGDPEHYVGVVAAISHRPPSAAGSPRPAPTSPRIRRSAQANRSGREADNRPDAPRRRSAGARDHAPAR
jgi:hypothetical protein